MKQYITCSGSFTPYDARKWIIKIQPYFHNFRQHDSHEVLIHMIDHLDRSIQKLFENKQYTTLKCLKCGFKTTTCNTSGICSVPFTEDLFESYEMYCKNVEKVEWKCDKCGFKGEADKKISNRKIVPDILGLHLKRWSGDGRKINDVIDVPKSIYKRELRSFISHSGGSAGGGHYVCYMHYFGKWWFVSDSHVQVITQDEAIDAMGKSYFFLYSL